MLPALAILGCGRIARRHAAAARRLGVPIVFASREPGRAEAYAREFRGLAAFGSYEAGLADPRVGAAIVCTPHDRHLADTLLALRAGKHVLVEKPIACSLAEADRMLAAAAEAGRIVMVGENFHYMPAFRWVRALLAAGAVGRLRELHLVARGYREHQDWRLVGERAGGGALIDAGIHYVHALRWWGGEVRRLYALRPAQTVAAMTGEDAVLLLAELEDGAVGFLANSVAARGMLRWQWSTVTGTDGTCFADNRGRVVLVRGVRGTRLRLFRRDVRGQEAMLRELVEAVTSGTPPEMDGVAGRRDLAVVLAAYRSLGEGQPIAPAC